MKNIMKEAHKMAKEITTKYANVDYKVQLGLCISYLSSKEEKGMVELKGTEKQVIWANEIRENMMVKFEEGIKKYTKVVEMVEAKNGKGTELAREIIKDMEEKREEILSNNKAEFFIDNKTRFTCAYDLVMYLEADKIKSNLLDKIVALSKNI